MAKIEINEIEGLFTVDVARDTGGNYVGVLKILGHTVLYAPEEVVLHPGTAHWNDVTSGVLARFLATQLMDSGAMEGWDFTSPTGREVSGD
jgi:hypothetical protein